MRLVLPGPRDSWPGAQDLADVARDLESAVPSSAQLFLPRWDVAPLNVVRFDRPFQFEIVHVETGLPLFMGRVSDPADHETLPLILQPKT